MDLVETKEAFRKALQSARDGGGSVGLVPTMGALHAGHLALVEAARSGCDCVAVTIFVNPTQFGDAADLAGYPRDLDTDLERCRDADVDVVFVPSVAEMYPAGPTETTVEPGALAQVLEGTSRPGHFVGVATIVTKLLGLAGSCRAYFGEKDFQQLAIVRRLVADLDLGVDVVGCPTVREPDGLAMASRNSRLSPPEREAAATLWRALRTGRDLIAGGERNPAPVEHAMAGVLRAEPMVDMDYAVVADPVSLRPVLDIESEVRLLVAAQVGPIRLIDNVAASLSPVAPATVGPASVGPMSVGPMSIGPMSIGPMSIGPMSIGPSPAVEEPDR
ncbi:MAG: pantoate--beta-alanine ligase [Acidimicrobiales bacterium]